jgi:hypothetical protein
MIKTFLARFPEFADEPRQGDRDVITSTLKAAEEELNSQLWGNLFTEGVLYLTADKLTRTAVGERFRPEGAEHSVYGLEFERLCRVISMGARVI